MSVTIRPVKSGDFFTWLDLFVAYGDFYETTVDDEKALIVWSWLESGEHAMRGVVAEQDDGTLVGFAHFRSFARPLRGTTGYFLDDLFVRPESRQKGIGRALIENVREEARKAGADVVRWTTAEDNSDAQRLYDEVAERTTWVTYDLTL